MSQSKELEELKNKRADLEEESRSLDEKEKTLEERVKILDERIAIQELEAHNQTMLNAVKGLESKIDELEKRLRKPPKEQETFTPIEEPKPEVTEAVQEEPLEGDVTVTAIEEPIIGQEVEEDQRKQHEKKKRRLF